MISFLSRRFGLAVVLLSPVLTTSTAPAAEAPARVFVGYLYGKPRDIHFSLYTHLCHAFLVADGDGRVHEDKNVPDPTLVAQAHAAHVKMLVSLGGWGWDRQFAAIVADSDAETRFVDQVIKIVDRADYDGVDIDWEYPDTEAEVTGFERLARRFRKRLDEIGTRKKRPMLVTMAASSNPGTLRWLKTDFLVETMDWVNLMTYDMAGDWSRYAGHHAPLHASSKQPGGAKNSVEMSVDYLLNERKLPPDHLALGIPLYGRGFSVGEPYASTQGVVKTKLPQGDYRHLQTLPNLGWTRTRDPETKVPWLVAPDKSAVIGYDDPQSVALKTQWGMSQGLRGVFFWQIDGDRLPDGSNPLQDASRTAWDEAVKASSRSK